MNRRVIGRIISISHNNVVAELYYNLGNFITLYDGIRFVGEIGSYVAVDDINRRIISEIIAVDEKSDMVSEKLNKAESHRYLRLNLIGEICNGKFSFGVTKMPPVFSEIMIISEADLQLMLDINSSEIVGDNGKTKLTVLPIGTSVIFPEYQVKVKLNEFFGFHFAVFGNTGAGKSNTIARLIQEVFAKTDYSAKGARFIVFDSNGEYESAFNSISEKNPAINVKFLSTARDAEKRLQIPVWALSVDDWAVLLHASEKTQVPIISRALDMIRVFDAPDDDDSAKKVKNHIVASVIKDVLSSNENPTTQNAKILMTLSKFHTEEIKLETIILPNVNDLFSSKTIIPYSLQRFTEAVEFAVLYEGSINSSRIYEYTSPLVTRLKHLSESEQGDFFDKTSFTSIDAYINDIIGESQLLNIDISNLDDTATEVVTKVFSKMLFDYLRALSPRNSMPINLILEEAHRFVRSDMDYGVLGYNIFERIAKEGRKFGLLMGISSQRPSELSKTVVSQCNNFIIHKIQNPDDIQYISRMVPYMNQGMVDRITYLRRGYALVFGTAINLPTLTAIEKATPSPNSGNSNIVEKWYVE